VVFLACVHLALFGCVVYQFTSLPHWKERLRSDPFCVECDVTPYFGQYQPELPARVSQVPVVKSSDDSELDEDAVEQSGTPADREQQHDSQQHLDHLHTSHTSRSTQPCIPPGSLNRVPASAGIRAGMSPLPGGR